MYVFIFLVTSAANSCSLGLRYVPFVSVPDCQFIAREPAVCLFMLLRPKDLKTENVSEAEKYAEFKNQSLRKIRRYTTWQYANEYPWHDPLIK